MIINAKEFKLKNGQTCVLRSATIDDEKGLLLIAEVDGGIVGSSSLSAISRYYRHAHRCGGAIALYQKYCGMGIGKIMLQTLLDIAKVCHYEQAELEVVRTNEVAYVNNYMMVKVL